jgi:hypothetical protein
MRIQCPSSLLIKKSIHMKDAAVVNTCQPCMAESSQTHQLWSCLELPRC